MRGRVSYREGVEQLGKKALATILEPCPLVTLLYGRKYGRFAGGTHGSPGPPQLYPPMMLREANLSIHIQNGCPYGTSSNVWLVEGIGSPKPAALETILDIWARVALFCHSKYGRLRGGTHAPAGGAPH